MPDFLQDQLKSLAHQAEVHVTPLPASEIRALAERRSSKRRVSTVLASAAAAAAIAAGVGYAALNNTSNTQPQPATTANPSVTPTSTQTPTESPTATPSDESTPTHKPTQQPSTPEATTKGKLPAITPAVIPDQVLYSRKPGDKGAMQRESNDSNFARSACVKSNYTDMPGFVRSYAASTGVTQSEPQGDEYPMAVHIIQFDSTQSADKAYETMRSWGKSCAQQVTIDFKTTVKTVMTDNQLTVAGMPSALTEYIAPSVMGAKEGTFHSYMVTKYQDRVILSTDELGGQDHNVDTEPNGPTGQMHELIKLVERLADPVKKG